MDPVRIFVGTEPKTQVMFRVLEHSVRANTAAPVEVTPMVGPGWEYPTAGFSQGTGFSLRRWMIPAACGWAGRAVYMDADQLVFGDVAELLAHAAAPAPAGTAVWCTYQPDKYSKAPWPQTSVMVIDCARAKAEWGFHLDRALAHLRATPDRKAYADFMHATWLATPPARLPVEWNHLNVYAPGKTRLLHYTKEPEQPCYRPDHPLAHLWKAALVRAARAGAVPRAEVEYALAQWGKKVDWRHQNGLHPAYKSVVKECSR